jgi:hypothetical protein
MIHSGLLGALARLRGLDSLLAREAAPLPAPQAATAGTGARASAGPLPDPHFPAQAAASAPGAATVLTGAGRLAASLPHAAAADIAARAGLDVSAATPASVALRLADDVATSGLFYEAHLADWVAGARSLDTLRREPQAAWSAAAQAAGEPAASPRDAGAASPRDSGAASPRDAGAAFPAAVGALANAADDPSRANAALPASGLAIDVAGDAASTVASDAAATAATTAASTEIPVLRGEARDVVAQQLAVLEQRRFTWNGEAWPGQKVAVAFEEDPATADRAAAPAPRRWTVRIATTLPTLGRVESTLELDGTALRAAIAADAPEAFDALLGTRAAFDAALAGAGVRLASLALERHAA